MAAEKEKEMAKSEPKLQDTADLRAFLLDKMVGVSDGNVAADQAKAICNLSQQVYNTLNIEVRVAAARASGNGEAPDAVKF